MLLDSSRFFMAAWSSSLAFLLSSTCVLLVGRFLWLRYGTPLSKIPGPFFASITSLWRYSIVRKSQMPWVNAELHQKHGRLVRVGPSHVSADSIEAVEAIYIEHKGFRKSDIYNLLQPEWEGAPLHNIFSTQDVQYHTLLKRNIGHLYSMSAVVGMESRIDIVLEMFIARLAGFTKGGPALVDMSAWLQYYTFDGQAQINFSKPIGFIESGADVHGFCHLDHMMMTYFAEWAQIPAVERLLSRVKSFYTKPQINPLYQFVLDHIQARLANPTDEPDFLNAVIRMQAKNPDTVTTREIIAATYINIVTGHDVTAIQLRALVYYVVRTPVVYQKLRAEIDEAVKSSFPPKPMRFTEIAKLPYINAVVSETLRIHPSAGLMLERFVPPEGIVLHDKFIPGGTTIGVNGWAISHNQEIFGDDVSIFRPERWIEESPEKLKRMRKAMFTFGAGARSCIGKNMAQLQLYKVVFELFKTFDVEWPSEDTTWSVVGGWLTRQTEMDMRLSLRT